VQWSTPALTALIACAHGNDGAERGVKVSFLVATDAFDPAHEAWAANLRSLSASSPTNVIAGLDPASQPSAGAQHDPWNARVEPNGAGSRVAVTGPNVSGAATSGRNEARGEQ
jgi:hypothetical protein